ncbi:MULTISPECIES: hypothetical protein [unclassified Rhizobium]|uniref:hypothetical protein n=1 Tax=unclassified Rhizobium TaxID=2613769 RepID=UPI001ADAFEC7|nr:MULTISPECIES: hypothetical protein [unclassified Rhizobium]MBO9125439.1 hypothetical protein [Rhizobium sp. 16-488-2b]MBO9176024.1 hypothetical protein [Rhizobium sp. 16-488-2a]
MDDQYVWLLPHELSRTDEEIMAISYLVGIEACKIGLAWQGRSTDGEKLQHFKKAITFHKYDPTQAGDTEDDV